MSDAVMYLISAVVGGAIAAVPVFIQSRRQERREAFKLAAETAWKDYEFQQQKGIPTSSAIIFVWQHVRLMKLIEDDKLTRHEIKRVLREKDDLNKAFAEMAWDREHPDAEPPS